MPRDDRQNPCRAFTPPVMLNLAFNVTRHPPMPHAAYIQAIQTAARPRRHYALVFGAAMGLTMPFVIAPVVTVARSYIEPTLGSGTGSLVAIGLLLGIPLFLAVLSLLRFAPRLLWKTWRPAALLQGSCPSCGHNLAGLPVEHDGCSTCAECGAAWKMEAVDAAERAGTLAPR